MNKNVKPISLIVCDIDGTLINSLHEMHPKTKEAIQHTIDKGIHVTVATGRSHDIALPIYKSLGMNAPLIALNGAIIRDKEHTFQNVSLSEKAVAHIIEFSKSKHIIPLLVQDNATIGLTTGTAESDLGRLLKWGWLEEYFSSFVFTDTFEQLNGYANQSINKICLVSHFTEAAPARAEMSTLKEELRSSLEKAKLLEDVGITSSHWNNIEIMPPNIDKGAGVQLLAKRFGLAKDEIMTIGDNENDVEMFACADFSVAMGNATDYVKSHAQYVTENVDNGGVGFAIERFVFNNVY